MDDTAPTPSPSGPQPVSAARAPGGRPSRQEADCALFRAVFDTSQDGIVITDLDQRRIVEANDGFLELVGEGRAAVLAKDPAACWADPGDYGRFLAALGDEGEVTRMRASLRRPDGRECIALVSATQVELEGRRHALCILREVTAEVRLEAELRHAKEQAEAASSAKSQLLASISQDIRTPLAGIISMADMALAAEGSGRLPEGARAQLAMMRDAAGDILDITSDILDLTRIEAGKMELRPRPFGLRDFLRRMLAQPRAQAAAKGLAFSLAVDDSLPDALCGDGMRLAQIISNLLSNALRNTDQGRILVDVGRDGQDPEGGAVILSVAVSDTGRGIPPEVQGRLFKRLPHDLAQDMAQDGQHLPGTGLGLSIVKRLAELMGGGVSFVSEPGFGSTFRVVVRLEAAAGGLGRNGEAARDRPADGRRGVPAGSPPRVVLAEDNPINRTYLLHILDSLGADVALAGDGREVLDILARQPVDLVLMDIQMPIMDGVACTQAIRSGQAPGVDPRLPIIALTAYAQAGDRERFLAQGFDAYLAKPFTRDELQRAMSAVLRGHVPPQASPPARAAAGLDLDETLERIFGGDMASLGQTLRLFAEHTPIQLADIEAGVTAMEADLVAGRCHSLANAAGMLLAEGLRRRALSLEDAARRKDLGTMSAALPGLRRDLEAVLKAVRDYQDRRSG